MSKNRKRTRKDNGKEPYVAHYAPYGLPVCEKDVKADDRMAEGSLSWLALTRRPQAAVCLRCFDFVMSVTRVDDGDGGVDGGFV